MSGFGLLEAIELTVTAPEKCLVSALSSDYGEGIILSGWQPLVTFNSKTLHLLSTQN